MNEIIIKWIDYYKTSLAIDYLNTSVYSSYSYSYSISAGSFNWLSSNKDWLLLSSLSSSNLIVRECRVSLLNNRFPSLLSPMWLLWQYIFFNWLWSWRNWPSTSVVWVSQHSFLDILILEAMGTSADNTPDWWWWGKNVIDSVFVIKLDGLSSCGKNCD